MSKTKSTLVRAAAAGAATVLLAVGGMAPALADHDHGNGSSRDHHAADRRDGKQSDGPEQAKGGNGRGDERGNGHTPVTVCHLLGNGSYHLLTFDDNALEAHVDHGDIYPVPAAGCPAGSEGDRSSTDPSTQGHTRVTVCHVLGNGGYHELTFDQHALPAHQAHGDLYPVPAAGCPAETAGESLPGTTPEGDDTTDGSVPGDEVAADTTTGNDTTVAGVEELDRTSTTADQPRAGEVLGVEGFAGVNRAAPVAGPLAGILPQTGAGQLGLAAAAGLVLVGAGAAMAARRRTQGV